MHTNVFIHACHTTIPHSLNDLAEFIKVTSSGLSVEVQEGDYDGLVGVMSHLLNVRDRIPTTDNMFEPLKQTIELLKNYGEEMADEVHQQLEVCASSVTEYQLSSVNDMVVVLSFLNTVAANAYHVVSHN